MTRPGTSQSPASARHHEGQQGVDSEGVPTARLLHSTIPDVDLILIVVVVDVDVVLDVDVVVDSFDDDDDDADHHHHRYNYDSHGDDDSHFDRFYSCNLIQRRFAS